MTDDLRDEIAERRTAAKLSNPEGGERPDVGELVEEMRRDSADRLADHDARMERLGRELDDTAERARLLRHNPYDVARAILAGDDVEGDALRSLARDYIALLREAAADRGADE